MKTIKIEESWLNYHKLHKFINFEKSRGFDLLKKTRRGFIKRRTLVRTRFFIDKKKKKLRTLILFSSAYDSNIILIHCTTIIYYCLLLIFVFDLEPSKGKIDCFYKNNFIRRKVLF